MTVLRARKLRATGFENLVGSLRFHRMTIQAVGVVFIFLTAFWGMYTNIVIGPLG